MKKKCTVILLETSYNSQIIFDRDKKLKLYSYPQKLVNLNEGRILYILSVDIPKIDDFILERDNKGEYYIPKKCYSFQEFKGLKLIATTDPDLQKEGVASIPQDFISKYVTEHNKGNVISDVMVEYDELGLNLVRRVNDNTVILRKVKETFTLDDMKKAYEAGYNHTLIGNDEEIYLDLGFEDWFEQQEF